MKINRIKINRIKIGTWDKKEPGIIWFEYFSGECGCKFLTVCNILFTYLANDDCYRMNRRSK
jgi:hypothetical protein